MKPQAMTIEAVAAQDAKVNAMTWSDMVARYDLLNAVVEATYAKTAPIQTKLDAENARAESARIRAVELADQIENIWGADWIATKREIGLIAKRMAVAKKLNLAPVA
ncbi:MAG: hypothetical protein IPM06_18815 [Rhizobiales bacterium]|nr:hypothetical protein [Hyphomicrobiales bacterium]